MIVQLEMIPVVLYQLFLLYLGKIPQDDTSGMTASDVIANGVCLYISRLLVGG